MDAPLPHPPNRLGLSGPLLGFGGAALKDLYGRRTSDDQAVATVRRALALGIRYFDTSPLYGESERRLGLALADFPREDLFLASKTGTHATPHDYTGEGTRRCVEQSLRRLGTDYLDLCLIHDPEDFEPCFAPGAALDTLVRLKEEGVIRAIGLGVRSHEFHRRAIRDGRFDAILTYLDYTLISQTALPLLDEARAAGVAVVLGSVLAMGFLSGRPVADVAAERGFSWANEQAAAARAVQEWAEANDEPLLRLALRFCLEEPAVTVALAAASTPAEVGANVAAAAVPVPRAVWEGLAAAGFPAGRVRLER